MAKRETYSCYESKLVCPTRGHILIYRGAMEQKEKKKENTNICDVGKSVTREEAEIADKPLGNRSV